MSDVVNVVLTSGESLTISDGDTWNRLQMALECQANWVTFLTPQGKVTIRVHEIVSIRQLSSGAA